MKYYNSYISRQEISPEAHKKLLNLEGQRKPGGHMWAQIGALAACCALLIGPLRWDDIRSSKSTAVPFASHVPPAVSGTGEVPSSPVADSQDVADSQGFVVSSPTDSGKLMFPMIPGIRYQDITGQPETAADRAFAPGSFMVGLEKEDIQAIFWGPEGKPEATHPKTEQGDLPWMLFWDGYTLHGHALYDGQGHLMELTIWGENGRASFELELRLGALPFTCCIDMNRGDQISEFNGVEVAGWSKVYNRDGDGQVNDYICGSEFMTKNDIGVRFVNQNSTMRAEYAPGRDMDLGGAQTFNALFVRQALTSGLYLDHLKTNEAIPAWREEEFSSLAQARQEKDFAPYLPTKEPEGYRNKEFYGRLSYQEGTQNTLFVRWSREYDNVEVAIYRDGIYPYNLVSPDEPEAYDLSLYPIPWCDSVPEEYRETVNDPAFRAEDMSLAIVEARGREHDTGGMTYSFDVLHPDGTVVSYRCDGLAAEQVWALVAETLT